MKISEFSPFASLSFSFSPSCHFAFLFSFASFPLPFLSFPLLSSFLPFFSYSSALPIFIPSTFLYRQHRTNTNPPPPLEIPNNVLIIDTSVYERVLYKMGHRGIMPDPNTGKTRDQGIMLSLENLLLSFTIPMLRASSPAPSLPAAGTEEQTQTSTPPDGPAQIQTQQQQQQIAQLPIVLPQCTMHNAGNDAMLCLLALQSCWTLLGRGCRV